MDKNVNVSNFQCHDFSLINERCPTLEFIRPFDASILHPRNFATYDFTLDILLLIYRMQFSNVDGSLVKQKIPVYKLYSYEEGFSLLFS